MNVADKVKEIIADALYADATNVKEDSRLMGDLGAESIDFLDIVFRLEQEFGIKLPKGDSEKRAKEGLSDEEFSINGVLQAQGLAKLSQMMPEIDAREFKIGLHENDIPSLYTVGTFIRMVEERILDVSVPKLAVATENTQSKSHPQVSRI